MTDTTLDYFLDGVYGSNANRTTNSIRRYIELYALDVLSNQWEVGTEFFTHCAKASNFVVLAIHDNKLNILVIDDPIQPSRNDIWGWSLPGGFIHDHRSESIEEAVTRIASKYVSGEILELEPVVAIKNTFTSNGQSLQHLGLVFTAYAVGAIKEHRGREIGFVPTPPDPMALENNRTFEIASQRLHQKYFKPPLEEVKTAHLLFPLRLFHRCVFKPLLYIFSSRKLKRKILSLLPRPLETVLDAAAGDDRLILQIANDFEPDLCVANDIAWNQMKPLRKKAKARKLNIIFTNHNIAELPFKQQFDLVVYKNTLHHARTKEELLTILGRLKNIAKILLIVDIEEPSREPRSKFFNLYYTYCHGDGPSDHRFFSGEKFETLITLFFADAMDRDYYRVKTLKGTYHIGMIRLLV